MIIIRKLSLFKARGGVRGQKNKFGLYQSPTCHGVTTFYGIAKSSFMTKIWCVKVRGYYSVPYKIQGGKMTKNGHFRSIFSKVLVSQCPNLPKSQILSSSTCFSKFHVQKCSNFENLSQKWSKKPIFHKNAFFSKSLKIDLLLQKLSQKHEIWTRYAEPQGLKIVGSRFLNF